MRTARLPVRVLLVAGPAAGLVGAVPGRGAGALPQLRGVGGAGHLRGRGRVLVVEALPGAEALDEGPRVERRVVEEAAVDQLAAQLLVDVVAPVGPVTPLGPVGQHVLALVRPLPQPVVAVRGPLLALLLPGGVERGTLILAALQAVAEVLPFGVLPVALPVLTLPLAPQPVALAQSLGQVGVPDLAPVPGEDVGVGRVGAEVFEVLERLGALELEVLALDVVGVALVLGVRPLGVRPPEVLQFDGLRRGGPLGWLAGVLLALFVCGLFGGAASLALALRPRVWRPAGPNDYSFVRPAAASEPAPPVTAEDERQLHAVIGFLSDVALRKYRCVTAAVVCTAVMGTTAGLCLLLRPLLG
ncbi:hypothetical protein ABT224_22025 [Streptomyces sp. NPDC001584]|uniref:hypothetical protein n=1 Tax=Streptomyces sp. NPDC001584 TaxID=3154521 RepID=UPI00332DB1C0